MPLEKVFLQLTILSLLWLICVCVCACACVLRLTFYFIKYLGREISYVLEFIIFSVHCAEGFPYRTSTTILTIKMKNEFSKVIYCTSSMCIKVYTEIALMHDRNIFFTLLKYPHLLPQTPRGYARNI